MECYTYYLKIFLLSNLYGICFENIFATPLYHLDKEEWEKHKDIIVNHSKVWSDFSKKVINKEMTKFEKLSDNVQMTQYGEDIKVIANFSDEIYEYENKKIKSKSLLIIDGENIYEYIPKA